ncbi:MAG: hypothetical protein ACYC26_15065 [Phycisphaerales bacterium]
MSDLLVKTANAPSIVDAVDFYRMDAFRRADAEHRSELGQFATPPRIATFMAGLFADPSPKSVRLLDAGAGVGSLTAAYVQELCGRKRKPREIHVVAWEVGDGKGDEYIIIPRHATVASIDDVVHIAAGLDACGSGHEAHFTNPHPPRQYMYSSPFLRHHL